MNTFFLLHACIFTLISMIIYARQWYYVDHILTLLLFPTSSFLSLLVLVLLLVASSVVGDYDGDCLKKHTGAGQHFSDILLNLFCCLKIIIFAFGKFVNEPSKCTHNNSSSSSCTSFSQICICI
jgi:hypothetical protein